MSQTHLLSDITCLGIYKLGGSMYYPHSLGTSNNTNSGLADLVLRDMDIRISSVAILILECILVLNNILAIIVFTRGRRSRTEISPLLINLCLSDLMTLIWIPMVIVAVIRELSFQALPYCVIMYTSQITSILTHLTIGTHRFMAIKFPILVHRVTNTYMVTAIIAIWIISICSALAGWSAGVCYDNTYVQVPPHIFTNVSIFVTLTFILPVCCCCLIYSLTGCELWGKKIVGFGSSARRQLQLRKRVMKMLGIIVFMFTVSWLPWTVLLLYDAYSGDVLDAVIGGAFVLAISNSFQNPLLCFLFNNGYRNDLKEILCCERVDRRNSYQATPTSTSLTAAERRRAFRNASWNVSVVSVDGRQVNNTKYNKSTSISFSSAP